MVRAMLMVPVTYLVVLSGNDVLHLYSSENWFAQPPPPYLIWLRFTLSGLACAAIIILSWQNGRLRNRPASPQADR